MIFACTYKYCIETRRNIPEGKAVECSVCANGHAMHPACYERHRQEAHGGKGVPLLKQNKRITRAVRCRPPRSATSWSR